MAFTFFFRDRYTLELLAEKLVSEDTRDVGLRIWDAGCAMGPEPYTLAIILAERLGAVGEGLTIEATDIDESGHFGEILERGIYRYADLSRMPEDVLAAYFHRQTDGDYRIVSSIRERVHYRWHDLLSLRPPGTGYHAIVCKNVLLHFTAEQCIDVLRMFHSVLRSGGFLVTEQTQKMPAACEAMFERIASDACIYRRC